MRGNRQRDATAALSHKKTLLDCCLWAHWWVIDYSQRAECAKWHAGRICMMDDFFMRFVRRAHQLVSRKKTRRTWWWMRTSYHKNIKRTRPTCISMNGKQLLTRNWFSVGVEEMRSFYALKTWPVYFGNICSMSHSPSWGIDKSLTSSAWVFLNEHI